MKIDEIIKEAGWINRSDSQNHQVRQLIIMMGSNENAYDNLTIAKNALYGLEYTKKLCPLVYHISQDHTGRSSLSYHNQAVVWMIHETKLKDVVNDLKSIERYCGRDDNKNSAEFGYLVALDLDVLCIYDGRWHNVIEQFPLKGHELICLGLQA